MFSCVKLVESAFQLHLPARATLCRFALAPTELGVSFYSSDFHMLHNEMTDELSEIILKQAMEKGFIIAKIISTPYSSS